MKIGVILSFLPIAVAAQPQFIDASSSLPVPHVYEGGWEHFVGGGVAVFDCDGDAFPDFLAAGGDAPATLYRNTTGTPGGALEFSVGAVPKMTAVTGAYPLNIDNDDYIDLVILRVGGNRLLKGGPDCQFTDHSENWGLIEKDAWTTAFAATWEGERAMPTLFFGNYVDRDHPDGPFGTCDENHVLRPVNGAYSEPIALSPGYCALSMLVSDWRRAGTPELRISNDRHYYLRGGYEEMWRLNPLSPRGEADGWEKISLWGMGIASADLTGDGFPEVMLTSMGDQVLQINMGDGFTNAPYSIGTYASIPHVGDDGRPSTGWHAEFGDVNNDGFLDLFIAKGNVDQMPSNAMRDPNNLLIQNDEGRFDEVSAQAGVSTLERSRGAALVDLNLDGLLDILVVNRRAPLEVWENKTARAGNWLQILLEQDAPNVNAIGAWIEVALSERTLTREVTVGGGHASGTLTPIHFGLGSVETANVRVVWPDGEKSDWSQYSANQRAVIRRTKN